MGSNNQSGKTDFPRELPALVRANPPGWAEHSLISITQRDYLELKCFVIQRQRSHHGVVKFEDIGSFIGKRGNQRLKWRDLFESCGDANQEEDHFWQADYWLDSSRKEGLSFVSVNDRLIISHGLHKAVLARYAMHYGGSDTLYGAKISRWSVDWDLRKAFFELHGLCRQSYPHLSVRPEHKSMSQTLKGHWMVDDYLLNIRVDDEQTGQTRYLSAPEVDEWLTELKAERPPEPRRLKLPSLRLVS